MAPGPAVSSGSIRVMRIAASPINSPPSSAAMSPRLKSATAAARPSTPVGSITGIALFRALCVERLDHLLGDVDARTDENHRVALQDQVVLFRFVDLLDHAVRTFDDRCELF